MIPIADNFLEKKLSFTSFAFHGLGVTA